MKIKMRMKENIHDDEKNSHKDAIEQDERVYAK